MLAPTQDTIMDVFISSTSRDLEKHRKQAIDAVWRREWYPRAMESGTAKPLNAIEVSLGWVDKAEIYIGIFAHRYGYVPDGYEISITEMEYRRALERGIPMLIFVTDTPRSAMKGTEEELQTLLEFDADKRKKLEDFKNELMTRHVVGQFDYYDDPRALGGLIYQSLTTPELEDYMAKQEEAQAELLKAQPKPAQPKKPERPPAYIPHRYTLTRQFVGRKAELGELDTWAKSDDSIMIVEAIGGMGKSALTWEWINQQIKAKRYDGVIWWSCYEHDGKDLSDFLRHVLHYIEQKPLDAYAGVDLPTRTHQVLEYLENGNYLLVLDGIERIMSAYHRMDAPHLLDDEVVETVSKNDSKRKCTDPRWGRFLQDLAGLKSTKTLMSTRLRPFDLENRTRQFIPRVRHKHLNGLADDDTISLFNHLGVKGTRRTILDFTRRVDNHSLLMGIIAGMVIDYFPAPSDFDRWYADEGKDIRFADLDISQRQSHILAYALKGLSPELSKLLSQIAAFRYPVSYDGLNALNPYMPARPDFGKEPREPDKFPPYADGKLDDLHEQLENATAEKEKQSAQKAIEAEEKRLDREYEQELKVYQDKIKQFENSKTVKDAKGQFHRGLSELEDRGLLQWDRNVNRFDLHPVVRSYALEQLRDDERKQTYNIIVIYFQALPGEDYAEVTELAHVQRSMEIYYAYFKAGDWDRAAEFYRGSFSETLLLNLNSFEIVIEMLEPLFVDGINSPPLLSSWNIQSYVANELAFAYQALGNLEKVMQLNQLAMKLRVDAQDSDALLVTIGNYGFSLSRSNHLTLSERYYDISYRIAVQSNDPEHVASTHFYWMHLYTEAGQWQKAINNYEELSSILDIWVYPAVYLVKLKFYQENDTSEALKQAWELARRYPDIQMELYLVEVELAVRDKQFDMALEKIQNAITLVNQSGMPSAKFLSTQARIYLYLGDREQAKQTIERALIERCFPFDMAKFYNDVAEVYQGLGEDAQARKYVLDAYEYAWADYPQFYHWYELERAKKLLAELGMDEPQLPQFDPASVGKIPYEDEILAFIEDIKIWQEVEAFVKRIDDEDNVAQEEIEVFVKKYKSDYVGRAYVKKQVIEKRDAYYDTSEDAKAFLRLLEDGD